MKAAPLCTAHVHAKPPGDWQKRHKAPAAALSSSGLPLRRSSTTAAGNFGGCGQTQHQPSRRLHLAVAAGDPSPGDPLHHDNMHGRNIVVAVDSSEDSQHALQWTARELYRPGDVLHVLHCIPNMAVPSGIYAVPDGRLAMVNVDALLANDEQFMLAESQAVQGMCARAFPPEEEVAHAVTIVREEPLGSGDKGRVAEAICRKADELQAAVVVIASHQKSGLSEFVLGSVAAHCTTHSSRPVLVLHAPSSGPASPGLLDRLASAAAGMLAGRVQQGVQTEAAQPAGSGAEVATAGDASVDSGCACQLRRNLVVAVDDSEASERACSWALSHFYRPGDTFHLLRIIPTLPFRASYGGPVLDGMVFYTEPPTEAFKSAAQHVVEHRFEPQLKAAGVPYQIDVIVEACDESVAGVGQAICEKAEELGAAAVVLGSHMSGGLMQFMLGSVATHVAHHCRRPVAVLH
ncbi:hypothetical protein ABPG77_006292 [Micractinium sp. CCAP 211/92]